MKRSFTYLITLFIVLFITTQLQAKIWRVNNNPNIKADLTTAQAAADSASADDTIHLEPSVSSYGSLLLNKRVVVIGVGYFLATDTGNQVRNNQFSTISSLTVTDASASSGVIMGLNVSGNITVSNGATGVIIKRCRAEGAVILRSAPNTIVTGCFLGSYRLPGPGTYPKPTSIDVGSSNNAVFTNNIFTYNIYVSSSNNNVLLVNNVINAIGTSPNSDDEVYNSTLQNNIFNKDETLTYSNCIFQNNLSSGKRLPTDANDTDNKDTVLMTKVFLNASGSTDASFQLKSGSPATGAGVDSVDCGAFGGANPFVLGLQPPIPAIYKLKIPATVAGDSLHVIFSTKSNN